MPQPQPRHQSRLNDIQMLQRQIMIKKLQELQRQQQFQELDDIRQHNYINQQSILNKQGSGDQFPPLINGTPIHGGSQRFMAGNVNFLHQGSSLVQGFSNGMEFPQAQSQALRSVSLVSPQYDSSLYGAPVTSVGNNLGQYSQLLGASHDSVYVFAKGNSNQEEKSLMQSLRSNQFDASSNQICMQGAFASGQVGQVPTQSSNSEVQGGNFQQASSLQRYTSEMEVGGSEDQAGWSGVVSEKVTHNGPSQSSCTLDPLEQKILFNMDNDSWDACFGRSGNISSGILQDAIENTDHTGSFPSVQSGSWSALMQSAVAEASSSETGQQEEWSGLNFQTEHLTDTQHSNFMDRGKQNLNWIDNNLVSVSSLSSKAQQFNNSNMNSSFPGFQHPGVQFSLKPKEGMCIDSSHDSNHHQSPKNNSKWFDINSAQKQTTEVSQAVQSFSHLQSAWPGHSHEHSETDARWRSIPSYPNESQAGKITGDAYKVSNSLWKTKDNHGAGSFSNSARSDHMKTIEDERATYVGHSQHHQIKSCQISLNNAFNGESGTYEKQECIQKENSCDSYHSNASQHNTLGNNFREHMWVHKSESRKVEGNQGPSNQVLCQQISQGQGGYELGYAEQLKFNSNVSSIGLNLLEKGHLPDIQKNLADKVSPRFNGSGWQDSSSSKYIASNSHGANLTAQTSQNMLELLHKVDNSNDYQLEMCFGSNDSTPISEALHTESHDSFAAHLYNKPSPSQSFGLRLSPPSQRFPNSNCVDSSQGSPQMGNSSGAVSSGPSLLRNQLQNQHQLNITPGSCRSQEAALPGSASSQDTSNLISTNPYCQPLPILEANPVSRPFVVSGVSQQAGFWTNAHTQRNQTGTESLKAPFSFLPSPDSVTSSLENTSTSMQEINNEIYFRGQNETDACSLKSEGSRFLGEQARKETSTWHISSGTLNTVSQKGKLAYAQESVPHSLADTTAHASGSLVMNPGHQGFDSASRGDNQSRKISDLEVFGRSLKPVHVSTQNYSLLQQVHSMKHLDNDQSKGIGNISGVDEFNPMSHTDLTSVGRMQHFSSEMKGNQSEQNLSQPLLQDTNQNSTFVHNDSPGISGSTTKSQISLQMAPSWFKHYGTLKNGQMLPMFDPRMGHQFNPNKVFEHLRMNSSVLQINSTDTAQASGIWPTTGNNLVAVNQPPYVLPHDITAQNSDVLRLKKRKSAAFEYLPWHKELVRGPERILDISLSDLQWAQAANRRIEKVADDAETTDDALNIQPKKRIASTTKLMQHIFRPAPAVVLSGHTTSKCDSVVHYAARLTLGDACCLSSNFHKPIDSCNMFAEKHKTPEQIGDKELTKLVEDFISRSKKLEANFLSLDKSASISDLRVEAQELEKFSLITRLAKFHSRGQAGPTEVSTSSGTIRRPYMHRYVTAAPMPRTLPEGAQCFQL